MSWGENGRGQLGDGTTTPSPFPVRADLEPGSPVVEIAGGTAHVLARLQNGQVYAWGADGAGQLGFEAGDEPWEQCGEGGACSTVPQQVYALSHVVQIAPAENASLVLEERADATRVVYSFGSTGHDELFGLGNVPYETTSTPTPITSIGPVRSISASLTTAVALLEHEPGRAPVLNAVPEQLGLHVTWDVPSTAYKLRYRPAGTREFSVPEEAHCHAPCEVTLTGLRPEPYEVTLKSPEGREGREKIRRVKRTPLPASGAPVNTTPPTVTGAPATETGKLAAGPEADGGPRRMDQPPARVHLRLAALQRPRRRRRQRRRGHRMRTDHQRSAGNPGHLQHLRTRAGRRRQDDRRRWSARPTPTASAWRAPKRNSCSRKAKKPNRRPPVHRRADASPGWPSKGIS